MNLHLFINSKSEIEAYNRKFHFENGDKSTALQRARQSTQYEIFVLYQYRLMEEGKRDYLNLSGFKWNYDF